MTAPDRVVLDYELKREWGLSATGLASGAYAITLGVSHLAQFV